MQQDGHAIFNLEKHCLPCADIAHDAWLNLSCVALQFQITSDHMTHDTVIIRLILLLMYGVTIAQCIV
jgi:hypothetical protein